MFESTQRLFSLVLGVLALAYALMALLRGKAHALRHEDDWTLEVHTTERIFTFPLILAVFVTLGALLILLGFGQAALLLSRYLLFSKIPALLARLIAIWLLSYVVVFFLSQIRRLFR